MFSGSHVTTQGTEGHRSLRTSVAYVNTSAITSAAYENQTKRLFFTDNSFNSSNLALYDEAQSYVCITNFSLTYCPYLLRVCLASTLIALTDLSLLTLWNIINISTICLIWSRRIISPSCSFVYTSVVLSI